jgi:hypothetical protein
LVISGVGYAVQASRHQEIPSGDELETGGFAWSLHPLRPGDGVVLLLGMIRKVSPGEVEILDISPVTESGFPEVARIVKFELGRRGPGLPPVPQSVYITHPPATTLISGECAVQKLEPVHGYVLQHGDDPSVRALVATWIQAEGVGEAVFDGLRVRYRSDGAEFFQEIPLKITVQVEQDASPQRLEAVERRCVDERDLLTSEND